MSYRKGKSFKEILVWAKLWRTDNFLYSKCKSHVLQLSCRQFLNLVTWDASKFDSMLSLSDQGSLRRPKRIDVSPHPALSWRKLKKTQKITFSSISPYSQNFIFYLLPTFSSRFLPPPYFFGPFLSPPYYVPHPIFFAMMGNVSLKVLEKSFNFFSKKGTKPEIIT